MSRTRRQNALSRLPAMGKLSVVEIMEPGYSGYGGESLPEIVSMCSPEDDPWTRCACCGKNIAWRVLVADETGQHFVLGQTCALRSHGVTLKGTTAEQIAAKAIHERALGRAEIRNALDSLTLEQRDWIPSLRDFMSGKPLSGVIEEWLAVVKTRRQGEGVARSILASITTEVEDRARQAAETAALAERERRQLMWARWRPLQKPVREASPGAYNALWGTSGALGRGDEAKAHELIQQFGLGGLLSLLVASSNPLSLEPVIGPMLVEVAMNAPKKVKLSKHCEAGDHDFDHVTAACRRKHCAATLTAPLFPMTQAEEEATYGFSASRAALGLKPGDTQTTLFNPAPVKVTLYRAAPDDMLLGPVAFAAKKSDAKAYTDNGPFGGVNLYRATAEIDPATILDLIGKRDELEALVAASGLQHPGAIGADEWVMFQGVADALLARGIRWVRLTESFPRGVETWVWLDTSGDDEPEMTKLKTNPSSRAALGFRPGDAQGSLLNPPRRTPTPGFYAPRVPRVPVIPHDTWRYKGESWEVAWVGATGKVGLMRLAMPYDTVEVDAGKLTLGGTRVEKNPSLIGTLASWTVAGALADTVLTPVRNAVEGLVGAALNPPGNPIEYLLRALEHAPPASKIPPPAPGLRGWLTVGIFVCATCAGRIMARGAHLPPPAEPVWSDQASPGTCVTCGRAENPPAFGEREFRGAVAAAKRLLAAGPDSRVARYKFEEAVERCASKSGVDPSDIATGAMDEARRESNPAPGEGLFTCRYFTAGGYAQDCEKQARGEGDQPPAGWGVADLRPGVRGWPKGPKAHAYSCGPCLRYGEESRARMRVHVERENPLNKRWTKAELKYLGKRYDGVLRPGEHQVLSTTSGAQKIGGRDVPEYVVLSTQGYHDATMEGIADAHLLDLERELDQPAHGIFPTEIAGRGWFVARVHWRDPAEKDWQNPPATALPEDPWRYFTAPEGTQLVPLSLISPLRARAGGIQRAGENMLAAYEGRGAPRKPITLAPAPDGTYVVCDGNSTYANAVASGWNAIPAMLVRACEAEAHVAANPRSTRVTFGRMSRGSGTEAGLADQDVLLDGQRAGVIEAETRDANERSSSRSARYVVTGYRVAFWAVEAPDATFDVQAGESPRAALARAQARAIQVLEQLPPAQGPSSNPSDELDVEGDYTSEATPLVIAVLGGMESPGGRMTVAEIAREAEVSESAVRKLLPKFKASGYVRRYETRRGKDVKRGYVWELSEKGMELLAWARRHAEEAPGATDFDPYEFEPKLPITGETVIDYEVDRGDPQDGPVTIHAYDKRAAREAGVLVMQLDPGYAEESRRFSGLSGPYALVVYARVHPDYRRLGVGTRLHEHAAREAAVRELPLVSPDDRTRAEGAFWAKQQHKHRARLARYQDARHPGASRYVLAYPPPDGLNPR